MPCKKGTKELRAINKGDKRTNKCTPICWKTSTQHGI